MRLSSVALGSDSGAIDVNIIDATSVLSDGLPDGVEDEPFGDADHFSAAEEGITVSLVATHFEASVSPHLSHSLGHGHPAGAAEETEGDSHIAVASASPGTFIAE